MIMMYPKLIDNAIKEQIRDRVGYYWEVVEGPNSTFPVLEIFFKGSYERALREEAEVKQLLFRQGFTHKQLSVDCEDLTDIKDGYCRVMVVFDPRTMTEEHLEIIIDQLAVFGDAEIC